MSPTEFLIPTYVQMLRTLAGLLDKAQTPTPDAGTDRLLSARLAPDMYPLSAQLRFAVYQAQEATFRLRGEPLPSWLEQIAQEGRSANECPGSIETIRSRIDSAISFLSDLAPDHLDGHEDRAISLALPNDIVFDMTGEQYVRDWALPQFYFHVVTSYAILRNQGIAIGKADYVPHMFAYLRATPGSHA